MKITVLISLVMLSACSLGKLNDNNQKNLDTRRLIKFKLNDQWGGLKGLPIESKKKYLEVCTEEVDTIFTQVDEVSFTFYISNDTIQLKVIGTNFNLEGQCIIPPIPNVLYESSFDIMTLDATLKPIIYYEPLRFGEWRIELNGESKVFNQNIKIQSLTEKCN